MTHMESLCSFQPALADELNGAVPLVDVKTECTISDQHGGATITTVTLTRAKLVELCAESGVIEAEAWLAGVYADGRKGAAE
jgi:hypothetical protein